MSEPSEFDDQGQWTGPCTDCGTNHDGYPPETFGGNMRCLRARAQALGAGWLVDQMDAAQRDFDQRRDDQLRKMGLIP